MIPHTASYRSRVSICNESSTLPHMSKRWVAVSRTRHGSELHDPDFGVRLTAGTRAHRKFVLREFKSSGITEEFYRLAFAEDPVHVAFEGYQTDPARAMALFERHPQFLSWHMLMTNGLLVWRIVEHPPFAQRFPGVASHVRAV